MLTIRLSRIGKTNKAMYRLIISEKAKDPYGRALEILGSYNPHTKELQAKADRIKYWISKGSGMSPTVNNLLIEKKIIEGKKTKASKAKSKKKGKKEEPKQEFAQNTKKTEDKSTKTEKKPNEEAETASETTKTEEKPVEVEKTAPNEAGTKIDKKPAEMEKTDVSAETSLPAKASASEGVKEEENKEKTE